MERTKELHDLYMETVVKRMFTCGTLKQSATQSEAWELHCFMFHGANKEHCKQGIEEFLRAAWRGERFSFFQSKGDKPGAFWVRFYSVDL